MVMLQRETFMHKGREWERIPAEAMQRYVMGVDLGQSLDYTAVSVIDHSITPLDDWDTNEATGKITQKADQFFDVRHLERLPLGMPYPQQVEHVKQLLARPPLRDSEVAVVLDQTGCGAPVADIAEQGGLRPIRITFTSGYEPQGSGRKWGVPKSTIVSCIDAKLNTGELRFASELLEADAIKDELANFHRHVSQTGKLLFEHRSGRHDDLIFSCAIGLWWTTWRYRFRLSYYGIKGLY